MKLKTSGMIPKSGFNLLVLDSKSFSSLESGPCVLKNSRRQVSIISPIRKFLVSLRSEKSGSDCSKWPLKTASAHVAAAAAAAVFSLDKDKEEEEVTAGLACDKEIIMDDVVVAVLLGKKKNFLWVGCHFTPNMAHRAGGSRVVTIIWCLHSAFGCCQEDQLPEFFSNPLARFLLLLLSFQT